ncbi:hypothetical protein D3C72_1408780 [compost metagenome]
MSVQKLPLIRIAVAAAIPMMERKDLQGRAKIFRKTILLCVLVGLSTCHRSSKVRLNGAGLGGRIASAGFRAKTERRASEDEIQPGMMPAASPR